jgi:Iron-containing redox enzyme
MGASRRELTRMRVDLASAPLSAATEAMIGQKDLAELLVSHSVLLHQITRASVPLMECARAECEKRPDDAVCRQFGPYLTHHIEEETHHDEWTLQDFEFIGVDRSVVWASIPAGNVAALVGAQYYWILHHHPIAILGYMIMLESNAPSGELVTDLQKRTGLPEEFFRSHQVHATLDPHHQEELFQLVDDLPLQPEHVKLVNESIMHTALMLADTLANPKLWDRAGAAKAARYS